MLQSIRNKSQHWIFIILITLAVVAFAFIGVESYFTGGRASTTVAKVGRHKVTRNEYDQTYRRLRRQLQLRVGQNFTLTREIETRLKKQAITQIINSYILTQHALNQGYRISKGQIDSALMQIPQFQLNGQFSAARFQAILNNIMYSQSAFIDQLRADMLVNQVHMGMVATSFALPAEITAGYQLINQKRTLSYFTIPKAQFKKDIKITPKMQHAYYQQHKNNYTTPEEVSIRYITLSMKALLAKQKFSPAQIKQYYETNQLSYTIPARWHVAQILVQVPPASSKSALNAARAKIMAIEKMLKSGKSFSEVAKAHSEDIATASKGGVMPWFTTGVIGGDFERAAKSLKVDEISKPIRTKFGFNIIKLLGYKPRKVQPFEKVKAAVVRMMAQDKAQKEFATQSDQLASLTFANVDTLGPASKTLGLPIKTTNLFSRKGTKSGITSKPVIVQAAFGNTTLTQGYNSDAIQLDPETVVVLRVKKHQAAAIRPFKAVQDDIIKHLSANAEKERAKILGVKLIQQAEKQGSMVKVANEHKLALKHVENAERHSKKADVAILDAAFALPVPTSTDKISVTGITLSSGDYAVIAITKVMNGNAKAMSTEQRNAFRLQLAEGYGQMDYALYARQQVSQAKVKYEPIITKS